MKGKHWIFGLICLSFLVVSAFCANAADKKPDVYTVALLGDMTGPYASVVGPMVPGAEDAIQYVNEQLGGIDGVKMKLVSRDNTGKAALGLQQYSELIGMTPKPNFFGVPHTPTAEALREKIVADDVLGFFPGSVPDLYPQGNAYSFYSLYPQQSAVFIMWLRANWTEERNPRVAIITWDQAYGRAILTPEFFEFCKKMKVDIVAQELFGVRDVDLTTHLVRIRAKNPDWLITNNTGPGPVAIMRAVKELGMNVKLANNVGGDWGTIRLDPQLFEGCISVLHCASYDDQEHSGIKQIYGYLKKNNRGVKEQTGFYILGWQYVLMVHKVVGEAVARVGWDKLSTAAIKTEMNKLTDWAPLDGVVKVTYTDKIRQSPYLRIYKVQGGQLVPPGGKLGGNEFIKAPDLTPAAYR
jgi:branched-chain amino acid transport system substrate-binding protein